MAVEALRRLTQRVGIWAGVHSAKYGSTRSSWVATTTDAGQGTDFNIHSDSARVLDAIHAAMVSVVVCQECGGVGACSAS